VKLLTIGEFARASRLSPKALRLYDSLGLLRPARVDEWTGYRYYSPDQLDQARLVAWLRRLDMPLAKIKEISGSPSAQVAAEVTAFVREAEADLAERKRLALFLVSYFSQGATAMSESAVPGSAYSSSPASVPAPLAIRYAAASDRGLVRDRNQDAFSAGPRLLAVADGFGPGGDAASASVLDALRPLESAVLPAGSPADLLNVLSDAVSEATASVQSLTASDPGLAGSGSTLTALLLSGSQLALVHIGDTRAYLLREGGLFQISHDHSLVQSMIDAGRLTPEEAFSHPQRSLLLRGLAGACEFGGAGGAGGGGGGGGGGGAGEVGGASGVGAGGADPRTPDLSLHQALPGDRYLLCSDGLTSVVPVPVIRAVLAEPGSPPEEVVSRLIALANEAGGPDNIACVVADVVQAA
jgi:serine/threonine protein phosphatase PrpC/DNA-binding transcriptional MerR regulator